MNERIKELMEQAEDPEHGFIIPEKFAELILNDVMSICEDLGDKGMDGHYCVDTIRRKYFGVEDTVQDSNLHTCPYAEEIHNDYETLCDCDEERTRQCAQDI